MYKRQCLVSRVKEDDLYVIKKQKSVSQEKGGRSSHIWIAPPVYRRGTFGSGLSQRTVIIPFMPPTIYIYGGDGQDLYMFKTAINWGGNPLGLGSGSNIDVSFYNNVDVERPHNTYEEYRENYFAIPENRAQGFTSAWDVALEEYFTPSVSSFETFPEVVVRFTKSGVNTDLNTIRLSSNDPKPQYAFTSSESSKVDNLFNLMVKTSVPNPRYEIRGGRIERDRAIIETLPIGSLRPQWVRAFGYTAEWAIVTPPRLIGRFPTQTLGLTDSDGNVYARRIPASNTSMFEANELARHPGDLELSEDGINDGNITVSLKYPPLYDDATISHAVTAGQSTDVRISPQTITYSQDVPIAGDTIPVEHKQFNLIGDLDPDTTDDTVTFRVRVDNESDAYDDVDQSYDVHVTDIAGERVLIRPTDINLYPEDHGSYNIRLNSDPQGSVTVRVSRKSGSTDIILVDDDTSTTELTSKDFVLNSSNWEAGLAVWLYNKGDNEPEGDFHAVFSNTIHTSTSTGYPTTLSPAPYDFIVDKIFRVDPNIPKSIYPITDTGGITVARYADRGGKRLNGKYYIEATELDLFGDTRTLVLREATDIQWPNNRDLPGE